MVVLALVVMVTGGPGLGWVGTIASNLRLPLGERLLRSPVPRLQCINDFGLDLLASAREGSGGECRSYVASHVIARHCQRRLSTSTRCDTQISAGGNQKL